MHGQNYFHNNGELLFAFSLSFSRECKSQRTSVFQLSKARGHEAMQGDKEPSALDAKTNGFSWIRPRSGFHIATTFHKHWFPLVPFWCSIKEKHTHYWKAVKVFLSPSTCCVRPGFLYVPLEPFVTEQIRKLIWESSCLFFSQIVKRLAQPWLVWLHWLGIIPQTGRLPGQGTYLGCGFGPGSVWKATDWCFSHLDVSLLLFLPPFHSLLKKFVHKNNLKKKETSTNLK